MICSLSPAADRRKKSALVMTFAAIRLDETVMTPTFLDRRVTAENYDWDAVDSLAEVDLGEVRSKGLDFLHIK